LTIAANVDRFKTMRILCVLTLSVTLSNGQLSLAQTPTEPTLPQTQAASENVKSAVLRSGLVLPAVAEGAVRVATFNVAMNRKLDGELVQDLKDHHEKAKRIATIVQLVSPDILLVNELDHSNGQSAVLFQEMLNTSQIPSLVNHPSPFTYHYTSTVNTGVPSGLDLNKNGKTTDSDDAWGFGVFPGQYGMVIYSKHPIQSKSVRTFQMLKWSNMPNAKRPSIVDKSTNETKFFHTDEIWAQLRLSSKSHWDVPVSIGGKTLHVLAAHPTPPVFDGPEDRNGCRNHDEIRLLKDYIEGGKDASYMVDDQGTAGGLGSNTNFVIVGDLNSDPIDGSGISQGIINLISSKRIASQFVPSSGGGAEASRKQGLVNIKHIGDAAHDTADFNDDSAGNLRVDFVLPSANCKVFGGGVYWPTETQLKDFDPKLSDASDHHLVWMDIQLND
jgi:hypothetical protein